MSKKNITSGFIYIWRDRKHNRYYIGSHWGTVDDGYVCSSRWMRKSYSRRPEDFKRRIIAWVKSSRIDLLIEEERWLQMIKPAEIKHRYFNFRRDTQHLWHAHEGEAKLSIGQKISAANKGRSYPRKMSMEEIGSRISKSKKASFAKRETELGYKFTPEHRETMSKAKLDAGMTHSAEWKQENSKRMKEQWESGARVGKPIDPSKKKPRRIVLCKMCGSDTMNPKKNFCSKEHRYQSMNETRKNKEGSKWFAPS